MNATPEQNDRYRRNICIDYGEAPHSAGRPRCDTCHAARPIALIEPTDRRR